MGGEGDGDFAAAMSDVAPLRREPRVGVTRGVASASDVALEYRRRAASEAPAGDRNPLSQLGVEPLDAWFILDFKRPGVQHGVFRKLKQGHYECQARLDLHQMTVERARREILAFIEESCELGLRTVLIIHGKGQGRTEAARGSILKGCVNSWLRELGQVQAFHSAQPRHGGTGAVYVLLRKSEEKKRENRERLSKGRVPLDRE